MQRSTEELTRCSTRTLSEEVVENIGTVTATRTVSEKIMSVCRKAIRWVYMLDLTLALSVTILLGILEFNMGPQRESGFFCNDPKISFKYKGDTISMALILTCSIILPITVIWIVEYVYYAADSYKNASSSDNSSGKTRSRQIWFWYGQYAVGLAILTLTCSLMKILIGEPRPHFLDTCKPREAINCTDNSYISSYTCTNRKYSNWFLRDSSKSFPSGHAALSIYMSIFLVWYLQNRLPNRTLLIKPWLQCLLGLWTVTCSMSRITDRRHHWWDVIAGNIMGFLFGLFIVTVSCQHFRLKYANVAAAYTFNESLENGQVINFDKPHSVKKLLNTAVIDASENREMKDIASTWKK